MKIPSTPQTEGGCRQCIDDFGNLIIPPPPHTEGICRRCLGCGFVWGMLLASLLAAATACVVLWIL